MRYTEYAICLLMVLTMMGCKESKSFVVTADSPVVAEEPVETPAEESTEAPDEKESDSEAIGAITREELDALEGRLDEYVKKEGDTISGSLQVHDTTTIAKGTVPTGALDPKGAVSSLYVYAPEVNELGKGSQILVGGAGQGGNFSQIGFGWTGSGAVQYASAVVGYEVTDSKDCMAGDLVLATRKGTACTAPPEEHVRIKADGKLGVGTSNPDSSLEVETTGKDAQIKADRTDGAASIVTATSNRVRVGAESPHNLDLVVNNDAKLTIASNGNIGVGVQNPIMPIELSNGAHCSQGGVWTDGSSRDLKQDIEELGLTEARAALEQLDPVSFRYHAEPDEEYLGFIAEDVPELVATANRKGMSPMDIAAVLTKVVQAQDARIAELEARLDELEKR